MTQVRDETKTAAWGLMREGITVNSLYVGPLSLCPH